MKPESEQIWHLNRIIVNVKAIFLNCWKHKGPKFISSMMSCDGGAGYLKLAFALSQNWYDWIDCLRTMWNMVSRTV